MAGIFRRAMEIMAPKYSNSLDTDKYEYQCMAFCDISTPKGKKEFERIVNNPLYRVISFFDVKSKGRIAIVVHYVDPTKDAVDYELEFGATLNPVEERLFTTGILKDERERYEAGKKRVEAEMEQHRKLARAMKAAAKKKVWKKVRAQAEAPKADAQDAEA